jgi:polysaccharide biosynthesis protein PelA
MKIIYNLFMHAQLTIVILCLVMNTPCTARGASPEQQKPLSVAIYYASNPPLDELKAFDIAVIDPSSGLTPAKYGTGPSQLFAYVSVGEAESGRNYFKLFEDAWLIGENRVWKSKVVDVSNPVWRQFFLDKVIEPLWQSGYRGFFLDTMDSYQLAAKKEDFSRMEAGLAETVRAIKDRHPEARLILNRGFEIFDQVKDITFAVAAESLYQNFNPVTGIYGVVPQGDREWLLGKLNAVKNTGVPVIAIDYVPPGNRELARQTAEKIKALGISPWVTDKDLAGLGVGTVEVLPRTVLGLYDRAESDDPADTRLTRFASMPLNELGYKVEMRDMRLPLPDGVLAGRYAGAVIWPASESSGTASRLLDWVRRQMDMGLKVVFLDGFGAAPENAAKVLGLGYGAIRRTPDNINITLRDQVVGMEVPPVPIAAEFVPVELQNGRSLLRLTSGAGMKSDAVAYTPWGGYALHPFVITQALSEQTRWVIDPFRFFKEALQLPDMPVPDVTTENGTRLLLVHVDGDGFESMAEWPGGKIAAVELRERILKKYRVPTTISIITGVTSAKGMYPQQSAELEKEARSIFSMPWVEAASHTYSHPFVWQKLTGAAQAEGYNLNIKGYSFNLQDEIGGSINYINSLLPAGKRTRLIQWSGDCAPGADAIEAAYKAGVGNINGGDTLITQTNKTLTAVSPLGVDKNGWFQVFAPNQNENVYTDLWTRNFYGYRRVIETFRLTDLPRRLKPVNIYYHFYSATKEASIRALDQVYDWALKERLFGIYTSDYVEKVSDFNRTVIAKDGGGWLVRNSGQLRQLRIAKKQGYPILSDNASLSGFNDHGEYRYLHMTPGGEARVQLQPAAPGVPYLIAAGGYLDSFERDANGVRLSLSSHTPFRVRFGNVSGCRLIKDGKTEKKSSENERTVELTEGKYALAIDCR